MDSRPLLSINISNLHSVHIAGAGGLAMVAMVGMTALAIPLAAWVLVCSAVSGAVAAAIVIRGKRTHVIGSPGEGLPMSLGLSDPRRAATLSPPAPPSAGGRRLVPRLASGY